MYGKEIERKFYRDLRKVMQGQDPASVLSNNHSLPIMYNSKFST